MKALLKVLFVTALASIAIVGCGDKGNNNGNNGFFNQPPGFPFGPNGAGDQFRGQVSITDGGLYQQYLEESRLCTQDLFGPFGGPSTCKWIDDNPFIAISFLEREYNNGLRANIVFDVVTSFNNVQRNNGSCHQYNPGFGGQWTGFQQFPQIGQQGCLVSFYNIRDNTELEATLFTASGQVQVQLLGTPTENQVMVQLSYRGRPMGTATLSRIAAFGNQFGNQFGNPYQQPFNPNNTGWPGR